MVGYSAFRRSIWGGTFVLISLFATVAAVQSVGDTSYSPELFDTADFRDRMRMLWEDQVVWTRFYMIGVLADLPDANASLGRLRGSGWDIARTIGAVYGGHSGDDLMQWIGSDLADHAEISGQVFQAIKQDDEAKLSVAYAAWVENADNLARLLASASSYLTFDELRSTLRLLLETIGLEALFHHLGDYALSISYHDSAREVVLGLAGLLSDGLIRQLPWRFTGQH